MLMQTTIDRIGAEGGYLKRESKNEFRLAVLTCKYSIRSSAMLHHQTS